MFATRARSRLALRLLRQDVDSEASVEAARDDATLRHPPRLPLWTQVQVDATAEGTPQDVHCVATLQPTRSTGRRRTRGIDVNQVIHDRSYY